MKKLIYILCVCWALASCSDDETYFGIPMPAENISFTPIAGGAVMHYRLPSDANVYNIRVRYRDAFDQELVRSGSYACDSLVIVGFNEARTGVKATITLCDRNDVESEPVEVTFDTKDSGPVAFFDNLEVGAGWGETFTLSYNIEADLTGMVHLFYVGEDPQTKKPDTLLIKSFVPTKGETSTVETFKQSRESYDVVVRTEDFRGYMVKEKVWKNLTPRKIEKYNLSVENFYDPENLSLEDRIYKLGKEYLFNGDLKGENGFHNQSMPMDNFNTYLAGPWAIASPDYPEKPLFIIDLEEERLPAEVRLYGQLPNRSFPYGPGSWYDDSYGVDPYGEAWNGNYETKLPSSVTLFGSNDMNDETSWVEIVHFEQERNLNNEARWCARCYGEWIEFFDLFLMEEPCFLSLQCPADGERYRYLKVVVHEVFDTPKGYDSPGVTNNPEKYVTIQELEIYTAKD